MTHQESFATSETVSIVPSITQNASILNRDNKQDVSLTTGLTVPHTPTVQYLTVTAQTLQPPNRGELGDLLSKDQIPDNPPNQDNREFPPSNCRRGTRSQSQTIHPIRTTGSSPPPIAGGGPGPNPGQSTQSGQQGVPPLQLQEGDQVPIPDNPPNQDNREFPPPPIAGGGPGPNPGQSTQSGQQGVPPLQLQEGDQVPIPDNPPNQDNREFPPFNCRRGTRSQSRTIHPIRTTGSSPPPIAGGGPCPNPGQSTQSGQQGGMGARPKLNYFEKGKINHRPIKPKKNLKER